MLRRELSVFRIQSAFNEKEDKMRTVNKIKNTNVEVQAPAAKAHTLRALVISSMAKGRTVIKHPLLAEDQLNLIGALRGLGIEIEQLADKLIVTGCGGKYSPVAETLNVGESGVSMNFLIAAACLADKPVIITGTKRLTERPIGEVVDGLVQLGCDIEYLEKQGFPPVKINPEGISGGLAKIKGEKTSQYFSSITISAPFAKQDVTLQCVDTMSEKPYFDISLQMMRQFGVEVKNDDYKEICVSSGQMYHSKEITVEGDYSSASFFFLAAAVNKCKVTVTGLNPQTAQGDKRFLDLLEKMGCKISALENAVCVEGGQLQAIEEDMSDIPDLVPPIAIAAAFAKGQSRFTNIGHLRHKECDRLGVMCSELAKMGAAAKCDQDSLIIDGTNNLHGAQIDPHNDHRIAMSFAIAGLATGSQIIENEKCVAKSFPDFWDRFEVFYQE